MASLARVAIHPSQFPENVRRDLRESLRTRRVNHKFHYDSVKQTQKWLALHQAYSPARTDPECAATYERGFEAAARRITLPSVEVVGLGCGGGQKDACLLRLLQSACKRVTYTPVDVSTAMVLVARQAALGLLVDSDCFPLVCDLATTEDLPAALAQLASLAGDRPKDSSGISSGPTAIIPKPARLFTFFGMLPNFEPEIVLPRLARIVAPDDYLLMSANLAPGPGYGAGVQRILPLYDNALTRDWLMTFLLDLGVESGDGELHFEVEESPTGNGLKRVVAHFDFLRARTIEVEGERFGFAAGDAVQLFFSYRHTPERVRSLLGRYQLEILEHWVTHSEEEGVFLVRCRSARRGGRQAKVVIWSPSR